MTPLPPLHTDSVLEAHYHNIEIKLLESVEKQRVGLEKEVYSKSHALKLAVEEKTELGVQLYQTRAHLNVLNKAIGQKYCISNKK